MQEVWREEDRQEDRYEKDQEVNSNPSFWGGRKPPFGLCNAKMLEPNEVRCQKLDARSQKSQASGLLQSAFCILASALARFLVTWCLGGETPISGSV